jgi:hypothetical protein
MNKDNEHPPKIVISKTEIAHCAAAYELVKRMALEYGYMKHERDTEGLEFFIKRVNEIVDDGELPLL